MKAIPSHPTSAGPQSPAFATTHWTVVITAREGGSIEAHQALEKLCRTYWFPLFAFVQRQGYGIEDAQDLTQEFFARFLEKDYLAHLKHRDGKFRSFLLKHLQHFLSDARDRAAAQKRGGGVTVFSLDGCSREQWQQVEPADGLSPDKAFDLHWANTLLARALNRVREEYAAQGKAELFERLKDCQPGERGAVSYKDLGARLNLTEGAIKTAIYRLRRRHREVLREEVAQTVAAAEEVDPEIRYLIRVLG